MLDEAALRQDLLDNAFGGRRHTARPPSIGAEVELLPMDAETGRPVPICAPDGRTCTLPFLRACADWFGWEETASVYGMPNWRLRDGATITFEPGGQIEVSTAPHRSASALLASLREVVGGLMDGAEDAGIELRSEGIDAVNAVSDIPLQLPGKRYVRLTRFLEDCGTGGTRMMRQTASFQCNLDWGGGAMERWGFLNALAPYVTAVFANSPVYGGRVTGFQSYRAQVWRELDGGRTGIFACGDDAVDEYLRFALDAPAILLGSDEDAWQPFRAWNERGMATMDDWRAHLTTLFPDVRPKGFVEVRGADAVLPAWYAAPLVFLGGLTYHKPSLAAARELVGAPDPALLARAARTGLRDPRIASVAHDLFSLALEGAEALGETWIEEDDLDEARAFFEEYTSRSRSPADDTLAAAAYPEETVAAD